jgi:hypothetical protein
MENTMERLDKTCRAQLAWFCKASHRIEKADPGLTTNFQAES